MFMSDCLDCCRFEIFVLGKVRVIIGLLICVLGVLFTLVRVW